MSSWLISLGYFGAFLGPLIGVFTFFLFPWPLIIFYLGYTHNPLLVAILGATGATLGTSLYYLVGEGIYRVLPLRLKPYLEKGQVYLRKYGVLAVLFFAALPLPDEIVWIPIGILRYNIRKAIVACWIGKLLFMLVISFAGYYGIKGILNLI